MPSGARTVGETRRGGIEVWVCVAVAEGVEVRGVGCWRSIPLLLGAERGL